MTSKTEQKARVGAFVLQIPLYYAIVIFGFTQNFGLGIALMVGLYFAAKGIRRATWGTKD